MSPSGALGGALAAALRDACGPDALLLGAWIGGDVVPALPPPLTAVRGVFAYPAERIAGLRAWRDTVELVENVDGNEFHMVLHEASKWARLVLKQHPGPALWSGGELLAADGAAAVLRELRVLACAVCGDDVTSWLAVAGRPGALPVPAAGAAVPGPAERFDQLERWLVGARRLATSR